MSPIKASIIDEGKPHKEGNVYLDGCVYLIHFDTPYKGAGHYLGWAHDFDARMLRHAKGHGSNLIKVIQKAGITWQVVRIWEPASPKVEAELKRYRNNRRLCPLCCKQMAFEKAEHLRSMRHAAKDLRSPKARYEEVIDQHEAGS